MARKARQKISYVLPLANSAGGHRLGVNGLAIDPVNSILYSGGRDGVICAWDVNVDLHSTSSEDTSKDTSTDKKPPPPSTFRKQVQAHTNWVNDIALASSHNALVSASSDVTVKVWRPAAQDRVPPQTIGTHSDYVKVLAVPDAAQDWVASGGLDHKICLWDLSGAGQKLSIEVTDNEDPTGFNKDKGSVYALAVTTGIIASGGPESVVRLWDARSGDRINKFVGHTDNIRDILISRDGETIMTASSDQTIKLWSLAAGRCMHTLTMHDASVWSLWSDDPDLSVFYSSGRDGMIAKTDIRNCDEPDEGISVAVCQEHQGVHKLVAAGNYIWTATSRPSISRWKSVDTTNAEPAFPDGYRNHRVSVSTSRSRLTTTRTRSPPRPSKRQIPLKHCLRLSNAAFFPSAFGSDDAHTTQSVYSTPDSAIEGQNGLIKHILLNDRRRVLTVDTAGEVVMWDLLQCKPLKSFGKRHIEDVQPEVSTMESIANWCSIDTRTGSLAITLDENMCFDAELYADELAEYEGEDDEKSDQRINLGKWVLRYLFADIVAAEMAKDEETRKTLLAAHNQQMIAQTDAPLGIRMPPNETNGWHAQDATDASGLANGLRSPGQSGLAINPGTPGVFPTVSNGSATQDDGDINSVNQNRQSTDYFTGRSPSAGVVSPTVNPITPGVPATPAALAETDKKSAAEDTKDPAADSKETPSKFGKKFRMGFSMKKLGKGLGSEKEKAVESTEKEDNDSDSRSDKTNDSRHFEDNLLGCVQKIRNEYKDALVQQAQQQSAQEAAGGALGSSRQLELQSLITPPPLSETPELRLPKNTTILIQEDRPEAGGVADLFEGTLGSMSSNLEAIEKVAPMWLGEVLLRNVLPVKDVVKISFVLEPWQNQLPSIAAEGNNRLNANRMLRARKVLAYVAERIEPAPADGSELPPAEDYLELWCNNQKIPVTMTLATIRAHIWRGGGDVPLYYKANGTRMLPNLPAVQKQDSAGSAGQSTPAAAL